jgi:hypothetical protein
MERKQTIVEIFPYLNKRLTNVKVAYCFLANKIQQEKGSNVTFSKSNLEDVLLVIAQFIEDFEEVSERFGSEYRHPTVAVPIIPPRMGESEEE